MHPLFVTSFHRDRRRGSAGRGTGQEAQRACGQARQISRGQDGCRRSPGSPAPPLRYEPACTGTRRHALQDHRAFPQADALPRAHAGGTSVLVV